MEHHKLKDYIVQTRERGNPFIKVTGSRKFLEIVMEAFQECHYSPIWPDQFKSFDWGVYINDVGKSDLGMIEAFLRLLSQVVFIDDQLEQTYALDYHMQQFGSGRTDVGELVFLIKYRNDYQSADELAKRFHDFIVDHPTLLRCDYVVSIPYWGHKVFSLPSHISNSLTKSLKKQHIQTHVFAIREIAPMKDIESIEEKMANISGAFAVSDGIDLKGKSVLVIDDVYRSGVTMNEMSRVLKRKGATVYGLVGTKTLRD